MSVHQGTGKDIDSAIEDARRKATASLPGGSLYECTVDRIKVSWGGFTGAVETHVSISCGIKQGDDGE